MRIPVLFTCLAAAALAALPLRPAVAQDALSGGEVTFNLFYDNLSDDGEWYNTPEYGYVWQPDIAYGQDSQWRPYTDGYWAQTDSGWTWVSYENFGWATYHYGRWTRLKDIGWAWVPGYEWGPGWVSWRTADDYVGWAPLPPKAERTVYEGRVVAPPRREREEIIDYNDVESEDTGYTSNVDVDYDIGPENYCFVESRSFGAPVLSEVILPPQRNVVIIERTTNVTNIFYDRRGRDDVFVYNSGPDYNFLSRRSERPIQRLQIEQRRDPGFLAQGLRAGGNPTQVRGGILQVAAPYFARRPTNFQQTKPARVKQTIAQPQVVHGWSNSGADPQTVERLRNRFKEQAQQAPAKAIQPKEQLVQSLPAAQRVVTKSDLPLGPAKDMSAEAVDARRAERRQQRAVQGGQPAQAGQPGQPAQQGGQPKDNSPEAKAARRAERQAGRNGQPGQPGVGTPSGQPAQAGQLGAAGPRPGALTEEERKARREAALQQKAARDQTRGSGQPAPEQAGQPGQPTQPGQPKDNSPEAKEARRTQRQQERAAQPAAAPGQPETAKGPAQSKESPEEVKAVRRAQRQQERAAQPQAQPQVQSPPNQGQDEAEKAARRAQRQQERAAQQPQGQPQPQPQADPDKEARRAQRQQAQGQQQAQQQQERAAQQQQAQQQEREARQAQRQQERAAQQQQAQQQQGSQEREARQAQRQQERAAQQQQAQPQQAAQPQPQAQPQQGNPDKEARRAARQAERGQPGN